MKTEYWIVTAFVLVAVWFILPQAICNNPISQRALRDQAKTERLASKIKPHGQDLDTTDMYGVTQFLNDCGCETLDN